VQINQIFLALLGGYIFYWTFHGTRYRAATLQPQLLIFPASLWGTMFIAAAIGLESSVEVVKDLVGWQDWCFRKALPASTVAFLFSIGVAAIKGRKKYKAQHRDQIHSVTTTILMALVALIYLVALLKPQFSWKELVHTFALSTGILFVCAVAVAIIRQLTKWPAIGLFFRMGVAQFIISLLLLDIVTYATPATKFWAKLEAQYQVANGGIPFLAFALAVISSLILNILIPEKAAAAFVHRSGAVNELKRLLFVALTEDKTVLVSMSDSKVYTGQIKNWPARDDKSDGYFVILPLSSGYRDKDTRKVSFTTYYSRAYIALEDELTKIFEMRGRPVDPVEFERRFESRLEDYYRVLPISEVTSVGLYDARASLYFGLNMDDGGGPLAFDDSQNDFERSG
jgi:hypothetical protein